MHEIIHLPARPRGLYDITAVVGRVVAGVSGDALCHVFVQHTSASLTIQENADPDVLHDLQGWFERAAPDGDPVYRHRDEGPDGMSAHIRSALTQTSLWVPVRDGRLLLGTWQGLYLFEHRTRPHSRRIVVSIVR